MTRQLLKKVLTDSGYPSAEKISAQCKARNVEIIAPWNESSFTAEKRAHAGEDRPIRKEEFTWDPTIPGYRCPQGNSLTYSEPHVETKGQRRLCGGTGDLLRPMRPTARSVRSRIDCVHSSSGGRTVRRRPHEDLIDEMRDRMNTPEGKALYGQRCCTVERPVRGHEDLSRGLQRISGRTLERAEAQSRLSRSWLTTSSPSTNSGRGWRAREKPREMPGLKPDGLSWGRGARRRRRWGADTRGKPSPKSSSPSVSPPSKLPSIPPFIKSRINARIRRNPNLCRDVR